MVYLKDMKKQNLAGYLVEAGVLRSPHIISAFEVVDRKGFVPKLLRPLAYADQALPIGHEQTISQPYTVAFMLELLDPQAGQKILDVGSGSGWSTTLLGHIVGKQGRVIGLERIPELVAMGQKNLRRFNYPWAEIRQADDDTIGLSAQAPYARILVSASADSIPDDLIDQLGVPGRLVIPVRDSIVLIKKDAGGNLDSQTYPGFVFVPLITDEESVNRNQEA